MHLLMAIVAAVSYTVGGLFMKLSAGFSNLVPSLLVYILFFVGATLQIHLTNGSHLGITYILVLGLEAGCAVLISHLVFKEPYSMSTVIGILLIILGTAFLRAEVG
jgi:small multidrug resistance pump